MAAGRGFPAAAEGRSQCCPIVPETEKRVVIRSAQLHSLCPQPTFSRLGSTPPGGTVLLLLQW